MIIKTGDFTNPSVIELLQQHLSEMHVNSPPDSVYALDYLSLQEANIDFWTVWEGDSLMGCGALKELSNQHGEIKSMRTQKKHLRKGVAGHLLEHILHVAKQRNYKRVSLETGSGPAFEAAIGLYKRYGFVFGDSFATYDKSKFNQFLHYSFE